MKKKVLNFFLSIALIFFCACNSAPSPVESTVEKPVFNEVAETEAIMKVIEGETNCFFNGDYDCWAKYWSHENYVLQAWNNFHLQ